jgi:hypothetical protein
MTVPIIIKVTTSDPKHNYFVHFSRDGHDLIDVCEYKLVFDPATGRLTGKLKEIIAAARTRLVTHFTPEALGEKP